MARLRRPLGLWLVFALVVGAMARDHPAPPVTIDAALAIDADLDAAADLDRRRADAIAGLAARCMIRHGVPFAIDPEPPPVIPDGTLGPIAWAERWGFGVSTSVDAVTAAPPVPDPNAARLARLGPADRPRITAALYGAADGSAGCLTEATDAVMGLRDRLMAPLAGDLGLMRSEIAADPRTAVAEDAWRGCLAASGVAAGERATAVPRLMTSFASRAAALSASGARPADGLAALQAEERRVAAVVATCESGYVADVAPVHDDAEARFVAAHADELARIGQAIRREEAAWPSR